MNTSEINREILRLAIPNMISNIIIPMLGMVDVAIAGRLGDDTNIAALAIGTTIFNFIYWNCSFLRMGTSGITAQAFGAGQKKECANMLIRSCWLAFILAFILVIFRKSIGSFSLHVMQGSDKVQALAGEYLFARIWAVPASITLFAIQGWFIGMQDAKIPMAISVISVIINAAFSVFFAFNLNMGIAGIAWGTVLAQYTGLLISCIMLLIKYREYIQYFDIKESLRLKPVIHFLHINKDIFLRSAFVVIVYTFFTAASARFGDAILATNALLMQLFTLFSYMSDGFAYAGESLTGRFVGEKNACLLKRFINKLLFWAVMIGILFVFVYVIAWKEILMIFSSSDEIIASAGKFIGWIVAVPLVGCIPFMIDGIMIGATQTKLLRNTVFIATALFFVGFYALSPFLGNDALWIAFIIFLLFRGILLYFCSDRLNVEKIMEGN
ncbi:MAG: MATE family efflux transporter [Tannerella sp.]|nr:MATE family efflux transporter [Tannerella sp.]